MKNTLIILIFTIGIFQGRSYAQDYHFSQFDVSEVSLNPALTGQFKNHLYRASMMHRNQWRSLVVKPFSTFNISYEMPLKAERWGIGGYAINYDGANFYNEINLVVSGSYRITKLLQQKHILTTGVQAGLINRKLNENDLTFNNQYDNGSFSNNLPSLEPFESYTKFMPEINWGIYYKYTPNRKFSAYGGFSVFHVSSPKSQFIEFSVSDLDRLPRRYLIHGGFTYEISDSYTIDFKTREMWQDKASEYYGGMELEYIIDKYINTRIRGGAYYRYNDAFVPMIGIEYKSLAFAVSYDITISRLKNYNGNMGGMEFTLKYAPKTRWVPKF